MTKWTNLEIAKALTDAMLTEGYEERPPKYFVFDAEKVMRQMRDEYEAALAEATGQWEPSAEVWENIQDGFDWVSGQPNGDMYCYTVEPQRNGWVWESPVAGIMMRAEMQLPLGHDWRQAKWQRPQQPGAGEGEQNG